MIELQITPEGGIRMLADDAVDLRPFGRVDVQRASHVEFSESEQAWFVQSAKSGQVLASGFESRGAALAWEKDYFGPSGQGWAEGGA